MKSRIWEYLTNPGFTDHIFSTSQVAESHFSESSHISTAASFSLQDDAALFQFCSISWLPVAAELGSKLQTLFPTELCQETAYTTQKKIPSEDLG